MEEGYALQFFNDALNAGNAMAPFSLLILFLGRMLPIIALSPFFGARVLPHPVKMAFAITLFLIMLPRLIATTTTPLAFTPLLLLLFVKEVFIGFLIGFLVTMPFNVVQNAGMVIDHQRGGASLMVNDPTIQNQSSPLGTIFNMVLICLFFMFDGPFLFLDMILDSFTIVPVDKFIAASFFEKEGAFWSQLMVLYNKVMIMSIEMATPGLLIILMTDLFLGITNRLAPQVQITFLGMPLKSLLALTVVGLGWNVYMTNFVKESREWLIYIQQLIQMLSLPTV